jgi:DNA-binding response OmpR family regulator
MASADRLVLVVDDEPDIRSLVCTMLQAAGFQTVAASDGDEVFALALAHRPAAVVLDLMMGRLDGYTALTRLRAHTATHEIPVVILTALGDVRYQALSAGVGALAHLTKPFTRRQLVDTVHRVVGADR